MTYYCEMISQTEIYVRERLVLESRLMPWLLVR
jgi:hypothetical protein